MLNTEFLNRLYLINNKLHKKSLVLINWNLIITIKYFKTNNYVKIIFTEKLSILKKYNTIMNMYFMLIVKYIILKILE